MVVFTCNICGEGLQKPKVEKHYQTVCRHAKNLTCVDCFKDFRDEEYVSHIKCMTEEERYAAKGSMPNGVLKKGEVKQQMWTEMINGILQHEQNNISVSVQNLLHHMSGYVNIPRKKAKLLNFISNSWGRKPPNPKDFDIVWDLIEKHKALQFPPKDAENGTGINSVEKNKSNGGTKIVNDDKIATTNGQTHKRKAETNINDATEDISKKRKKSKNNENTKANIEVETGITNGEGEETTNGDATSDKFSYENKILEVLNIKKQISLKKLQKKVLCAYVKHHGVEEPTVKQVKKFNKRLRKLPNVEVKDDLVVLT